jgi:hypothetical protein
LGGGIRAHVALPYAAILLAFRILALQKSMLREAEKIPMLLSNQRIANKLQIG